MLGTFLLFSGDIDNTESCPVDVLIAAKLLVPLSPEGSGGIDEWIHASEVIRSKVKVPNYSSIKRN